ncbi:class I SAM-dependent methyltransferase [Flavobacteriaceae bacterium M23B6Z8]
MKCILCNSDNLKTKQSIDKDEIVKCYLEENNIDVSEEFKELTKINYVSCRNCDLSFFQPGINGSSHFYNQIQENHQSYYKKARPEFFTAQPFISAESDLLEVGSGDASFAKLITPKSYIGLEYSDEAIRKAKEDNIILKKQSIEEFASEKENTEKFDVVCSFHVLEHVENPNLFIQSCLKVLKSGGRLILAVPCRDSILTNNFNHTLNLPPHHLSRWSSKSFENFAKLFEVEIEKLFVDDLLSKRYKSYFDFLWAKKINKLYKPSREVLDYSQDYFRLLNLVKKINRRFKLYKFSKKNGWKGENMLVVLKKK